jgi:hypothetical protein
LPMHAMITPTNFSSSVILYNCEGSGCLLLFLWIERQQMSGLGAKEFRSETTTSLLLLPYVREFVFRDDMRQGWKCV